jgi:hypothetical protein
LTQPITKCKHFLKVAIFVILFQNGTKHVAFCHPTLERVAHPSPVADDVRAGLIADPGFGKVFTDHMVTIKYTEGQGLA